MIAMTELQNICIIYVSYFTYLSSSLLPGSQSEEECMCSNQRTHSSLLDLKWGKNKHLSRSTGSWDFIYGREQGEKKWPLSSTIAVEQMQLQIWF